MERTMTNQALVSQIIELRTRCEAIDRIDPCSPAYSKLISFLSGLDQDHLQVIVAAKIKWLSALARNRIVKAA
jgi:hypothetical protein